MYIHEGRGLVYLAHPKCASRAVRDALKEHGFVRSVFAPNSKPNKCGNRSGPDHHKGLKEHPGPEWTVFTAVRNHFDAWASWFSYSAKTGEQFCPRFIERLMDKQNYFPEPDKMWAYHTEFADHVLRYETQAADLSNLLGEQVQLPVVGVSERREKRPYQALYTPELAEYVADRFGDEMEHYGYRWEGAPPALTKPAQIVDGRLCVE